MSLASDVLVLSRLGWKRNKRVGELVNVWIGVLSPIDGLGVSIGQH